MNAVREHTGLDITKEQILSFLMAEGSEKDHLQSLADAKKKLYHKNKVYIRGVIEMSNTCQNSCKYCSMSIENKSLKRYIIPVHQIIDCITYWYEQGIRVFHLSSGESKNLNFDGLCECVKYIASLKSKSILVVGSLSTEKLQQLKKAGANTIIEKFETSNAWLYNEYGNKDGCLDFRMNHLLNARKLGFKIGTGNIVGLPYQTLTTLVEDILLLKKIAPEHASTSQFISSGASVFSTFNPNPATKDKALNVLSILRLVLDGTTLIPSNSSFGQEGKIHALRAGANLLSVNLTPKEYLEDYIIYDTKRRVSADLDALKFMLDSLKMEPCFDF